MGQSASKASKVAAAAGRRQYPSTPSIVNNAPGPSTTNAPPQTTKSFAPSQVHPSPASSPPSETKDQHIDLDGRDPQFGASLRKLGPAIAVPSGSSFPTSSQPPSAQQSQQDIFPPSNPASNPALRIVAARERAAKKFEMEAGELGRQSFAGRTLVSAKEITDALRMRDEKGAGAEAVEKQLRLKKGVLDMLGPRGMVENANV